MNIFVANRQSIRKYEGKRKCDCCEMKKGACIKKEG